MRRLSTNQRRIEAAQVRRRLVLDMLKSGMSAAKIGAALGISRQRVCAILKGCPPEEVAAAQAKTRELRRLIAAAVSDAP